LGYEYVTDLFRLHRTRTACSFSRFFLHSVTFSTNKYIFLRAKDKHGNVCTSPRIYSKFCFSL